VLCSTHLGDAAHSHCAGTNSLRAPLQAPPTFNRSRKEHTIERLRHSLLSRTGLFFGRSFFPLFAIALIAGGMLWGPWVSLGVTVVAIAIVFRSL
jgi:hypothetical protein